MSEPRFLVQVQILVRSGEASLLVRSGDPDHPGCWDLPGANVPPGGDPVATAQAAVGPATGLPVHLSGLIGIYSAIATDHRMIFVFQGESPRLPPAPRDLTILEARWITDGELAGLLGHQISSPQRLTRILRHAAQGHLLPLSRFWRPEPPASSPPPAPSQATSSRPLRSGRSDR